MTYLFSVHVSTGFQSVMSVFHIILEHCAGPFYMEEPEFLVTFHFSFSLVILLPPHMQCFPAVILFQSPYYISQPFPEHVTAALPG